MELLGWFLLIMQEVLEVQAEELLMDKVVLVMYTDTVVQEMKEVILRQKALMEVSMKEVVELMEVLEEAVVELQDRLEVKFLKQVIMEVVAVMELKPL